MDAGRWVGRVDAAPAAEHLRRYLACGGTVWEAVRACGVSETTLKHVLYKEHKTAIIGDTADRIMALVVPTRPVPPEDQTYAAGSLHRMQALYFDGWPLRVVNRQCRVPDPSTWTMCSFVTNVNAERVKRAVDNFYGSDRPGRSEITAGRARRAGFLPLAWWPDIDDPDCQPIPPLEPVMIDRFLHPRARPFNQPGPPPPPACWPVHRIFRANVPCLACWHYRHNRDEAIRVGSVPKPHGPGLGAEVLGDLVGCNQRTVVRVRARYAAAGNPGREDRSEAA